MEDLIEILKPINMEFSFKLKTWIFFKLKTEFNYLREKILLITY